jgi:hypothetical protein
MASFISNKKQKTNTDTFEFDKIRQTLEETIIEELRYHYHTEVQKELPKCNSTKVNKLKIIQEGDYRLGKDLLHRNFCEKYPPTKVTNLIPKISQNFTLTIPEACVVLLFLYYGLVLSEQYDDTIDDMLSLLQILVGTQKADKLYNKIILIASDSNRHCSEIRRTLLFS